MVDVALSKPRALALMWPGLALSGWTVFVWLQRLRNVLDDRASVGGELAGWGFTWRFGVALLFCLAAVVGAGLVWAARRRSETHPVLTRIAARFFVAFAAVGIAWWSVRGVGTLLADFSVGFKVVHTVLALVTIGLGVVVIRTARPAV